MTHEWNFVLSGRFLELRTRSISRRDGKPDDSHEDVGFISRDTDSGTFVFRQFLSEGFVNTYDVSIRSGETRQIVFAYREAESAGGMRAQMRLSFVAEDEYDLVLDLAASGEDFVPCQQMHMKKTE